MSDSWGRRGAPSLLTKTPAGGLPRAPVWGRDGILSISTTTVPPPARRVYASTRVGWPGGGADHRSAPPGGAAAHQPPPRALPPVRRGRVGLRYIRPSPGPLRSDETGEFLALSLHAHGISRASRFEGGRRGRVKPPSPPPFLHIVVAVAVTIAPASAGRRGGCWSAAPPSLPPLPSWGALSPSYAFGFFLLWHHCLAVLYKRFPGPLVPEDGTYHRREREVHPYGRGEDPALRFPRRAILQRMLRRVLPRAALVAFRRALPSNATQVPSEAPVPGHHLRCTEGEPAPSPSDPFGQAGADCIDDPPAGQARPRQPVCPGRQEASPSVDLHHRDGPGGHYPILGFPLQLTYLFGSFAVHHRGELQWGLSRQDRRRRVGCRSVCPNRSARQAALYSAQYRAETSRGDHFLCPHGGRIKGHRGPHPHVQSADPSPRTSYVWE